MNADELILAAAAGAVCLAICATVWALAQQRLGRRRLQGLQRRVSELEMRAEVAQSSAEAFDSALLAVEDGRALLASGEESLAVCATALDLAESDAQGLVNALMRADPDNARRLRALFERGEACAFEVRGPAGVVSVEGRAAGALAWLRQRGVQGVIPIVGARTVTQLAENLGCLGLHPGAEVLLRLDALAPPPLGYPEALLAGDFFQTMMLGAVRGQVRWPGPDTPPA